MIDPQNLKYTKEHEWVKIEDETAVVGITDYAQGELGDIIYIELPEVGEEVETDNSFGTIEAVKAVSDLYAPISGEVVEINSELDNNPEVINSDPFGDGWIIKIKIKNMQEVGELLDYTQYKALI